jgi:hypothetical protein
MTDPPTGQSSEGGNVTREQMKAQLEELKRSVQERTGRKVPAVNPRSGLEEQGAKVLQALSAMDEQGRRDHHR